MSIGNQQAIEILIRKGLIQDSDLTNGGRLNPVQADRFIDYVIDETSLDEFSRVIRFSANEYNIDKINVGRRAAVPVEEGRDPGVRRKVTTSQVVLSPVELMVPLELTTTFLEHNIEGADVEDHIARMFAKKFGMDIEELYLLGNKLGPGVIESTIYDEGSTSLVVKDSYLAKIDGWLLQADDGHMVDIEGNSITLNVFSQMLNAMPTKFKRRPSELVFLCPPELEQLYRERIATRATAAGDVAMNSQGRLTPFGVPLIPVPLLPMNPVTVEHVSFTAGSTATLNYTDILEGSVVVTSTTLGGTAISPFTETTDYTVDEAAGTITQVTSQLGGTVTVKVTYQSSPQILLTRKGNLISAIGRDMTVERDRDIFARLNQWAMTVKVDAKFEETDMVVKAKNIASTL